MRFKYPDGIVYAVGLCYALQFVYLWSYTLSFSWSVVLRGYRRVGTPLASDLMYPRSLCALICTCCGSDAHSV